MAFTSGFLIVGLLMTLAGAILVYMSLRASPNDFETQDGVLFLGPLPIVVKDGRKWIFAAVVITMVVMVYLATKSVIPGLLGGIING